MRKPRPRITPSTSGDGADGVSRLTWVAVVVLLAASIALVATVRLRLADTPLERDEGEYAYAGQLIRQGTPPYSLVYNMKFPGTYYSYAVVMSVFGESPRGIRIGLLCVNVMTALLLFGFARRLAGPLSGGCAAAAFLLLSLDRWSMGVFAHATHFVLLPVVAGLFVLWPVFDRPRRWRFVVAGALMGLAIVMKQQAFPFAALAVGLAAWSARGTEASAWRESTRRAALVLAGVVATLLTLVLVLAMQGVLGRFWFWTFEYAAAYLSQTPLSAAGSVFAMAWGYITQSAWLWWYGAAAGVVCLLVTRVPVLVRWTLGGWLVASAVAIAPGFYFRPHYFIVAMPVAACLVAVAIASVDRWLARAVGALSGRLAALAVFVMIAGAYAWINAGYFFRMTPHELVRALYQVNPFDESPAIGRYIRDRTSAADRIVVLGSEPQIYFYANRRSATGYVYTYPLMEPHQHASRMQTEMRQEIETARPAFLVFVASPLSWMTRPESDTSILRWANEYANRCYTRVGLVDIPPAGPAAIMWEEDSRQYVPRSSSQVYVLRRTAAPGCAPSGQ